MTKKILIIDDELQIRSLLARIISYEGYAVTQAETLKDAAKQLSLFKADVVLCDVLLPDGNGIDFIPQIKAVVPNCEVIMLTAHGNIADGVKAIKNGAFDYLTKGDDNKRILSLLAAAVERVSLKSLTKKQEAIIKRTYTFDSILGSAPSLLSAIDLARKVAVTDASTLLTGETGTGKEVFANAIHLGSKRTGKTFVAINCSAFSAELIESELFGYKAGAFTGAVKDKKGLFEQADGGTIFLDEIGEMPLPLQAKLLRTLENGEILRVGDCNATYVDVRVIAATNRNLQECIVNGTFREDLYYRLSVFTIELPPLRDRRDDIILLTDSYIDAFGAKMGKKIKEVEKNFYEALINYRWKGNIRELRNTIERSLIVCNDNCLKLNDLPFEIQRPK